MGSVCSRAETQRRMVGNMMKLLFASKNRHKLAEANLALRNYGVELVSADVEKLEIQSDSLEEIALYAARYAYTKIRRPVVVEDAGLFVYALHGFPGPYSSYVYKTIGIEGLLKLMKGVEDRRAKFVSVVAFALNENDVLVFRGEVEGAIALEPRGSGGFGFDPIFIPCGFTTTFAEMSLKRKVEVCHRGIAFRKLGRWIAGNRDKLIRLL